MRHAIVSNLEVIEGLSKVECGCEETLVLVYMVQVIAEYRYELTENNSKTENY